MLARLSAWILRVLGWELHAPLPQHPKYVLIAAPHTSNWDFPLGYMAALAIRLDVHWLGKHSLFGWPFGRFFRAMGGIPVHRGEGRNYIGQLKELFDQSTHLALALAPEGTRSKTDHWKTGFHYIARAANVPIVMAYLDYGKREIGLSSPFYPSDDIARDFDMIREYYKDRRGKNPEKESSIRLQKGDG